ncbi:protein of unknown function [Candidatus Hydrogenisulfobacillus filiaventi]|uniref:Dihydrolipoyl dehydrogenase n=1 Tax=Candidatus Hydrogenisulfobacillus filiaventi TaxID=2707344 RepID=A0A6F8ZJI8_9FIRM|nr:protein of unknown function [Candidatus Hydrogenisulfobacillus filiaventi]
MLVAVGRRPNTAGLAWERAGIRLGPRAEVPVDAASRTAVPHIYAPGDVNGGIMLAHAATRQSQLAARHLLGLPVEPLPVVPHVIFSDPEIAAVGADSRDLADHPGWRVTRWPYAQDARARIVGDLQGFAQMGWDPADHRPYGLQVIGRNAGELIHGATQVITRGGTMDDIAASIHPPQP